MEEMEEFCVDLCHYTITENCQHSGSVKLAKRKIKNFVWMEEYKL